MRIGWRRRATFAGHTFQATAAPPRFPLGLRLIEPRLLTFHAGK
jgi:hypothetical protein